MDEKWLIPLLGGKGRQALGWVEQQQTHPGTSRPQSLRATLPQEGIFRRAEYEFLGYFEDCPKGA